MRHSSVIDCTRQHLDNKMSESYEWQFSPSVATAVDAHSVLLFTCISLSLSMRAIHTFMCPSPPWNSRSTLFWYFSRTTNVNMENFSTKLLQWQQGQWRCRRLPVCCMRDTHLYRNTVFRWGFLCWHCVGNRFESAIDEVFELLVKWSLMCFAFAWFAL